MPGGPVSSAKLIADYYRKNGTLPKIAAAPESEEEQLYRALARIRLLERKRKPEQAAAGQSRKSGHAWVNTPGIHSIL